MVIPRDEDFEALERRWREAFGEYQTLSRTVVPEVARWEWATGERYNSRPLYWKRFPGRGRLCEKRSEEVWRCPVEYGFDRLDRVILMRRHHQLYPPLETFIRYDAEHVEAVTFSTVTGTAIPGEVEHFYRLNDRVERYASFKLNGFGPGPQYHGDHSPDGIKKLFSHESGIIRTHETYEYEDDRVARIRVRHEGFFPDPWEYVEYVSYDGKGSVEQIKAIGKDYERVLYRKPLRGQTLTSVLAAAQSGLAEAIPQVLAQAKFTELLYCVELWYRAADFYFPPVIIPGFERDRQRILANKPPQEWWQVWTPELDRNQPFPPYPTTDPAVLETCERAEQEIHTREAWNQGRKVLEGMAKVLTDRDWSGILEVTADFVVFAIDHELTPIEEALKASVPRQQIDEWRSKGWLPWSRTSVSYKYRRNVLD